MTYISFILIAAVALYQSWCVGKLKKELWQVRANLTSVQCQTSNQLLSLRAELIARTK